MSSAKTLADLASALLSGSVRVVDLPAPLGPETHVIQPPPRSARTRRRLRSTAFPITTTSSAPFWAWNWLELGEHAHSTRCMDRRKRLSLRAIIAFPSRVSSHRSTLSIARRGGAVQSDHLLTVDSIKAWEKEHGEIEQGGGARHRQQTGAKATTAHRDFSECRCERPTAGSDRRQVITYLI